MKITDYTLVKNAIYMRPDDANKGSCGSLLSISGSYGMAGASILAGKGALRSGIGLLKTALPKSIYPIASQCMLESVFYPLDETEDGKISKNNIPFLIEQANTSKAVLIGCGISVSEDTKEVVYSLIENCTKPMVIDADALNCVSENKGILKQAKAPIIITPHPGEMSRLNGLSIKEINSNREQTAKAFAEQYGVICVLKGKGTIIAKSDSSNETELFINPTGNSGMATGGSGDVLAGIIGALLAQETKPYKSAAAGVFIHGLAGDIASEKYGKISMLPSDLIDCIHLAFNEILNHK